MLRLGVIIFAYIVFVPKIEAGRILAYFPTPSISHQVVFRALTLELAKRGHEVVVITPDPAFPKGKAPLNLTEIDVHDISYKIWEKEVVVYNNGNKEQTTYRLFEYLKCFATIVDAQLEMPEVKTILKRDRKYFDILLIESIHRTILGLAHIFDAPIVQISSFGIGGFQYSNLGAVRHPMLYPTPERQRMYGLSFREKCIEYLKQVVLHFVVQISEKEDDAVIRKHFGRNVPSIYELNKRVKMIFVNEHKVWSSNRPVSSNIQFIGGLHLKPQKDLPQDLESFMNSSENGVIYVSFGTNVITGVLPQEKIVSMINVLSKLPYDILWKWDADELPAKSNNIKILKWLPQADLLKHPKLKLFVTQGGLQSTDEAIDAGVPLIGIPIYGDQWYNVEKYAHFNIGLQLDITELTEEVFENAVKTVLSNKSYKDSIIKLRGQMMNQPISPLDLAVWWTEHIIEHGGDHIQPPSVFMSYYDYYEVNMIIMFTIVLLSIATIVVLVFRTLLGVVLRAANVKLKSQ